MVLIVAIVLFAAGVTLVAYALLREYYSDDAELFDTVVDETKKRP